MTAPINLSAEAHDLIQGQGVSAQGPTGPLGLRPEPCGLGHPASVPNASERLRLRMEELDARFAPERRASEEAMRIVDRDLPQLPATNPLKDQDGFLAGALRSGERYRLYKVTFARLMAEEWLQGDEELSRSLTMVPPVGVGR